jgi:hypothetical protein
MDIQQIEQRLNELQTLVEQLRGPVGIHKHYGYVTEYGMPTETKEMLGRVQKAAWALYWVATPTPIPPTPDNPMMPHHSTTATTCPHCGYTVTIRLS